MTPRALRSFAPALACLVLLTSTAASVAAQQARLAFRHLTIADGLSQNAVQAITQDRRGFMWLGTRDGLNRYDGYEFEVFRRDPLDSLTLSDSDVTALLTDRDGRVWIGGHNGSVSRFDSGRETFRSYPGGPSRPVTSLAMDAAGGLWIGTDGGGLYRLASEEGSAPLFEHFVHDPADRMSLVDDRVLSLLVDRQGTLWIGTAEGLNRLDRGASTAEGFTRYGAGAAPEGLIDRPVTALLEDRSGRLWVGSTPGLSVFDADRRSITHFPHRYREPEYGRARGEAVDLLEDQRGRIWITTHIGLVLLDPQTAAFTYFRHDPSDPESISADGPSALFQDRSGVIWMGTLGYGIDVHDPKADRFKTFRRPEGFPSLSDGFSVYTLFEDSRGQIWIGADVLYRWDRSTGELVSYETDLSRLDTFGATGVWSIREDPVGVLWVGSQRGLYRHELATGRSRHYKHDPDVPDGLPEEEARDVFRDREGGLWVVSENYLAQMTDAATGRFRFWRYKERPTEHTWTFPSAHVASDGTFWLGSDQGLVQFDPTTADFRRFRHDATRPGSLAHDEIRAIAPDPRDPERFLWIGTAGAGLDRLDVETGSFEHHTVKDGLPNDVVYGVLPDDEGRLWLSTNRGLSRFDPRTGSFRNYDEADGLQSNEFNSGSYFRSAAGELFFGGVYGFNFFRPAEVTDNPHVPEVVITRFRRGNRPETPRDSGAVLTRSISETDSLRLSYRDDLVAFDFAVLDYSAPTKNRYAYRMVGLSDEWVESGSVRTATYTDLPPGSYVFQVRGSNNDGVWNEDGRSLVLSVTPPWWRTWWASTLLGVTVLAFFLAVRRHELGRIRLAHRLEVERREGDQLRELERARSRFFANVSHEFRTPLTLTLGPLDDLRAGLHGGLTDVAREQVELARRNAGRVLALVNQILELARLEAGGGRLQARRLDLAALVRDVAGRFAPLAERRAITCDVHLPAGPVDVFGDPARMDQVLANLISNALKYTPSGGAVRVRVEGDEQAARVIVRDSGPGIPAHELPRVFDRFYRVESPTAPAAPGTGIGLALAKEIVELHGGTVAAASEEGFGSTFTVTLRRGHAHLSDDQVAVEGGVETWTPPPDVDDQDPWPLSSGAEPEGDPANDEVDEDLTTVLVVEDNPEVLEYERKHLRSRYRVLEASTGEAALALTRERLPDLVLSDVMMPGAMDGYALCRAIKESPETDFIPVILLTARAAVEDRVAGLERHADDYVTKPFDMTELLARVDNLITGRRRLEERYGRRPSAPVLHPTALDVEPADERFLSQVRLVIEGHLSDESFTVDRLAGEVHHSRGHLHRRLTSLLDETPSELIWRMRLERGAQMLEARAGSVAQVAYAVGFKSVSHFSRRFVRRFGVRPSAYPPGETATQ